jgi:hypothetical protein
MGHDYRPSRYVTQKAPNSINITDRSHYPLLMVKTLTDALAAWAEARSGQKSLPWAINRMRKNLMIFRRAWIFGTSSIYLAPLDVSIRRHPKNVHSVTFAARRLARQ